MQLNTLTQKNKKLLITFVTIMCLLCTLMAFIPVFTPATPEADAWYSGSYETLTFAQRKANVKEKAGGFAAMVFDYIAISEGAHPDWSWTKISANIFKTAQFSFTLSGRTINLATIGKTIYESMKVVGVALIFLYFLIEILDEVQADHFSIEHLIKKLITLTVAMLVLNQGGNLFQYILNMGDPLIDLVADAVGQAQSQPLTKAFYDEMVNADSGIISTIIIMIASVASLAANIIPCLLTMVAVLIAYLVGYSRYFEIMLRFAFAPIGLSQLVSGGAKGAGMRYVKKFASAVIQGAVCVAVFGIIPILSGNTSLGSVIGKLIVPLTAIGVIMKAPRIADDIVGV